MDSNSRVSGQCWIMEFEIRKPRQMVPRSRNLSEDPQSRRIVRQRYQCTRQCSILRSSQTLTKVTSHYLILFKLCFWLTNAHFIRPLSFFVGNKNLQVLHWDIPSSSHCSWEFLVWFSQLAKASRRRFYDSKHWFFRPIRIVISDFLI